MGKGGYSLISAGEHRRPSTVLQIFQEAARLLWSSRKRVLSILLILLVPHALLYLGAYLVVSPLTTDMATKFITMSTKERRSPEYRELLAAVMKDLPELTGSEVAIILVAFLLSSFLLMAVVHTVAMARKGEQVGLGDQLSRIRRTWKGPVITKLYVAVISLGCTVLMLFILFAALTFASIAKGSVALLALYAVIAVSAVFSALLLVYLEVVWCQGLVISVLEEDCYGLAALGRASQLIRGRARLGFWVNFHLVLITALVSMVFSFVTTALPQGKTAHLAAGLAMTGVRLLMSVFMLAVYVVFYYECKKGYGEEVGMKGSLVYTSVPTAPAVDEALP